MKKESLVNIVKIKEGVKPLPTAPSAANSLRMSDYEMLQNIREDMYTMGRSYVAAFNVVNGIAAVRASNMSYRCAMQAIRLGLKYTTV